jgi:thiol:disulfide interchange protein
MSQTNRVFFTITVLAVMLISGCNAAPTPTATPNSVSTNYLHPYDENANAQQDIDMALKLAQADHKYVLLDFGGNWCPDCIVLAKLYETEPLKAFVEKNYHIVTIDIGQFDKNLVISAQYGNPINNGVPAVIVLDPAGKMIGSTGDGAFANARNMNAKQVLSLLQKWTPPQS